jgi:hypothetical protein
LDAVVTVAGVRFEKNVVHTYGLLIDSVTRAVVMGVLQISGVAGALASLTEVNLLIADKAGNFLEKGEYDGADAVALLEDAAAYTNSAILGIEGYAPTAASIGLGDVDNTSDVNKPVSTLQAAAIANAKLNSGEVDFRENPTGNEEVSPWSAIITLTLKSGEQVTVDLTPILERIPHEYDPQGNQTDGGYPDLSFEQIINGILTGPQGSVNPDVENGFNYDYNPMTGDKIDGDHPLATPNASWYELDDKFAFSGFSTPNPDKSQDTHSTYFIQHYGNHRISQVLGSYHRPVWEDFSRKLHWAAMKDDPEIVATYRPDATTVGVKLNVPIAGATAATFVAYDLTTGEETTPSAVSGSNPYSLTVAASASVGIRLA